MAARAGIVAAITGQTKTIINQAAGIASKRGGGIAVDVPQTFGPRVIRLKRQAARKAMFQRGVKSLIVTVSRVRFILDQTEIRERYLGMAIRHRAWRDRVHVYSYNHFVGIGAQIAKPGQP